MIGELTTKIKLHSLQISVEDALHQPRLVRKSLEMPLVIQDNRPWLVGRDEDIANLVIDDSYISRTHAAFIRENEKFYLQDLHSKNGTYLNGERLPSGERSTQALQDGDRIRFNIIEFRFVCPKSHL